MNLAEIRREYQKRILEKNAVDANPIHQLEKWIEEAKEAQCPEYTAMTIATSNAEGQPSMRIVLLKYVKDDSLFFFTNYRSRKGKDLAINNKIAAHFFWPELERQVKVEGFVHKAAPEVSDFYFNSRPRDSQISAVISNQSAEVADRETLEKSWQEEAKKWEGKEIERPDYWGGYQIKPTRIEFWQGRPFRLHDRLAYQKSIDGWRIKRLAP
ncbi:MAG: pyridoxamine 5'-phosphate oxidase [Prolixibacteraceae bacterium]